MKKNLIAAALSFSLAGTADAASPCSDPNVLDAVIGHVLGPLKPFYPSSQASEVLKDVREETGMFGRMLGRIDCSVIVSIGLNPVRRQYHLSPLTQGGYQVTVD
jgi:hypothetical protein